MRPSEKQIQKEKEPEKKKGQEIKKKKKIERRLGTILELDELNASGDRVWLT